MTVRSARLAGPLAIPSPAGILATVPAGHRWVVRSCNLCNQSTSTAITVNLFLNSSSTTDRLAHIAIGADLSVELQPWWVLNAGDSLYGGRAGAACNVTLMGYDLLV